MQHDRPVLARDLINDWAAYTSARCLARTLDGLNNIYETKTVYPRREDVFKALRLCPPSECKVIILGQDPYFQKDVATGIAFANSADTPFNKWSPSLKVLRNAAVDLQVPHNLVTFDPTLESWESQGVLLLNSALTVEAGKPGSHLLLWRHFISSVLGMSSRYNPNIVYLLLGNTAQTFRPYISRSCTCLIDKHPSFYARTGRDMPSDLFHTINKLMRERYDTTIEWYKEETI